MDITYLLIHRSLGQVKQGFMFGKPLENANISDVPVIARPTPNLTLQCESLVCERVE